MGIRKHSFSLVPTLTNKKQGGIFAADFRKVGQLRGRRFKQLGDFDVMPRSIGERADQIIHQNHFWLDDLSDIFQLRIRLLPAQWKYHPTNPQDCNPGRNRIS
ncbi:hypothetical protein [Pararhodobacter sp.]|uniref:hypothetical protein n=1 Tax=Pararhodobacter sp. TaxID=2127056 RepID=UPI002FDD18B6